MSLPSEFSAEILRTSPQTFSQLTPPAKLAVLGDPISHSLSPDLHNSALQACGIPLQYVRLCVPPKELAHSLKALAPAGFLGANITLPHKIEALRWIDEIDEDARLMGAVNTVVVNEEGKLTGFNTDGPGIIRAIREQFRIDVRDLHVLILGAGGGAGRAIAVQCALEGCQRLVLANRTPKKAEALRHELAPLMESDRLLGPANRIDAIGMDEASLAREIARTDLLINATTQGMHSSDPALIPSALFTPNLMVFDTIYTSGKTRLLLDAEAMGARTASGHALLLHQGALAFELWFHRPAPLEIMRQALRAAS